MDILIHDVLPFLPKEELKKTAKSINRQNVYNNAQSLIASREMLNEYKSLLEREYINHVLIQCVYCIRPNRMVEFLYEF